MERQELGSGGAARHRDNPSAQIDFLNDIQCTGATACTAVGYWNSAPGDGPPNVTQAEVWNGRTWTPEKTPDPDYRNDGNDELNALSCISKICTAVGERENGTTGNYRSLAERT